MKLPKSDEMRALDKSAIESFGIPSIVLMENAGLGTVNMMEQEIGPAEGTFALILIGPGNNGGDGLVIGRHLHQRGCLPIFFFLVNPDELKGDAKLNLNIIRQLRLPFHVIDNANRVQTIRVLFKQIESRGQDCYAIIDALFGTGLSTDITGHFADTIDLFNRPDFTHSIPIVAVDTPSGMDSDTGRIRGTCLKADLTATYACAKAGQVIHGSTSLIGKLHIIDIGIPLEAINQANIETELLTKDVVSATISKLKRKVDCHKGSNGHLLILAGSIGKTGAAILAGRGALKSGCGLVSLCVPYDLNAIFESSLVEAMTIPLPTSSSLLNVSDLSHVINQMEDKKAIVLGPGIGTDPRTAELVLHIYHSAKMPIVVDADAINILAKHKAQLRPPAGPRIFTPHPGELSRIIDSSFEEIENNRIGSAKLACDVFKNSQHQTIIVLKGPGTIIASDNGSTVINTTGNPGMATGGMGDVLSGMIASLICQGLSCHDATCSAVYLHGLSADSLFETAGQGFSATDLANNVPSQLNQFLG